MTKSDGGPAFHTDARIEFLGITGIEEKAQKGMTRRHFMDMEALATMVGVDSGTVAQLASQLAGVVHELDCCQTFVDKAKASVKPRKHFQYDLFKERCGVYDLNRHGGKA